MKAKFLKQIEIDFVDHRFDYTDAGAMDIKIFRKDEIIEIDSFARIGKFIDLVFPNGDEAMGVPEESLTFL